MGLKKQIKRIIPPFLLRTIRNWREMKNLRIYQKLPRSTEQLRSIRNVELKELFDSSEVEMMWNNSKKRLDELSITDKAHGVNPGDRRAIYYLINKLRPSSVLEVGTHIGASTLHIASALFISQIKDNRHANLVSVDIVDVNDPIKKLWMKYSMKHSPLEMVDQMGFGTFVKFVKGNSVNYLNYLIRCEQKFDLIFLDGDHSSETVYKEILSALNLLNKDGLILLHDYFPNLKPLWSNGEVIPGPFLALELLKEEGVNLVALPLHKLPWPTMLRSNVTSLALLLRNK